jgi:hypothetical protein
MNKIIRFGALGCAAAAGLSLLPAMAANAAPVAREAVPAPPVGTIKMCNLSGYTFDVYADGPSIREDDLAAFQRNPECTDWKPVLAGNYQIGFGVRSTSGQNVIIQARFKRNDHVYYKVFNNEGVLSGFVGNKDKVLVFLFIPQA